MRSFPSSCCFLPISSKQSPEHLQYRRTYAFSVNVRQQGSHLHEKKKLHFESLCVAHRIRPVYMIFAEPYKNQIVRNKCKSLFGWLQSDLFDRLLCKSVI